MQMIRKYRVDADGSVFTYHSVYSVKFPPEQGFITLVVGSWADDPSERFSPKPEREEEVTMYMDRPPEEFIANSTLYLMELPDWDGELIDDSTPKPPEITVQDPIFPTAATGFIPVVYPTDGD